MAHDREHTQAALLCLRKCDISLFSVGGSDPFESVISCEKACAFITYSIFLFESVIFLYGDESLRNPDCTVFLISCPPLTPNLASRDMVTKWIVTHDWRMPPVRFFRPTLMFQNFLLVLRKEAQNAGCSGPCTEGAMGNAICMRAARPPNQPCAGLLALARHTRP